MSKKCGKSKCAHSMSGILLSRYIWQKFRKIRNSEFLFQQRTGLWRLSSPTVCNNWKTVNGFLFIFVAVCTVHLQNLHDDEVFKEFCLCWILQHWKILVGCISFLQIPPKTFNEKDDVWRYRTIYLLNSNYGKQSLLRSLMQNAFKHCALVDIVLKAKKIADY